VKIIIAGAGTVGYNLAKTLSSHHDVTVIDRNIDAATRLMDDLDILAICGDAEDPNTYANMEAGADFFIAVTDSDEANIISSLIADDMIDIKKKIVRFKNSFFAKHSLKEKLNIFASVFPAYETANTLAHLLEFPKANNVKILDHTDTALVSVRARNMHLKKDDAKQLQDSVIIAGIEREGDFFIPESDEQIQDNDLLYLFGMKDDLKKSYLEFDSEMPKSIRNCVIFGGGALGVEMARVLAAKNIQVKIIEKSLELCESASKALQNSATVLHSRYGWEHLFEEEGIKHADMMIAATKDDEYNVIKCMEGKRSGIAKVIAVNDDIEYYSLMHSLGIVAIRGNKINAYYKILEKIHSSKIVTEKIFCGGKGSLMTQKIFPDSNLIGKKIESLKKIRRYARVYLIRQNTITQADETSIYMKNDVVAIFSQLKNLEMLKTWISEA
jgi:trk system potassium uptake protein TrkA